MNALELLAAATPRPWREGTSSGAVVADELMTGETGEGRSEPETVAFYGGIIVGESLLEPDRRLVLTAVNEYEALLACEHYLRVLLTQRDTAMLFLAHDALAEIGKVRG